jgi:hypothetical protein
VNTLKTPPLAFNINICIEKNGTKYRIEMCVLEKCCAAGGRRARIMHGHGDMVGQLRQYFLSIWELGGDKTGLHFLPKKGKSGVHSGRQNRFAKRHFWQTKQIAKWQNDGRHRQPPFRVRRHGVEEGVVGPVVNVTVYAEGVEIKVECTGDVKNIAEKGAGTHSRAMQVTGYS